MYFEIIEPYQQRRYPVELPVDSKIDAFIESIFNITRKDGVTRSSHMLTNGVSELKESNLTIEGCFMDEGVNVLYMMPRQPLKIKNSATKEVVNILMLNPDWSLSDLRIAIRETEGISPDRQNIIVNGNQLKNKRRKLSECGVKPGDTLHMTLKLRGGCVICGIDICGCLGMGNSGGGGMDLCCCCDSVGLTDY